MNYRHEFHAGNFADVFKHIFLTRIVSYLKQKPAAFRFVDTHAGSGIYDLTAEAAVRTGEWQEGIGRLMEGPFEAGADALIKPYLTLVGPYLKDKLYPGSPVIARDLLRAQDRLILCELHPEAMTSLRCHFGRRSKARLIEIDAYIALRAYIPPVERRGLVLIDPSFEQADEFDTLLDAVNTAWRKWPTGLFMIWYPVKDPARVQSFCQGLKDHQIKKMLRLELQVKALEREAPLARCGLIVINPPYPLEAEAKLILPALVSSLATHGPGSFLAEWLVGE